MSIGKKEEFKSGISNPENLEALSDVITFGGAFRLPNKETSYSGFVGRLFLSV